MMLSILFLCMILHISGTYEYRNRGDNFPIISHLRPDTQNSHLAWMSWSFERSPKAYTRFELYECNPNSTYADSNSVPNTERLAVVPNNEFEAVIRNMPETKRPCVIVCAIMREWLASCSIKFACYNTKYTIPSGAMRSMIPNIAPLMVRARRNFDRLKVTWDFSFQNTQISSFHIELDYGTDQSYQSIDNMLHSTEIVQHTDYSVNLRLDGSQIESEKFAFIKVCSVAQIQHKEDRNCSELLVIPLSEVEEDLEEDTAVQITTIRSHIRSASIMLSEPLESRKTSELHVMCIADHSRSDGNRAGVMEWRTENMFGNTISLEGLTPATQYRCNMMAKPNSNSIAYIIYARKEFKFRTKSVRIENPPTPVTHGKQYMLQGNIVMHPFSVQLAPTSPQIEVSSYLLVAWPQHKDLPTQFGEDTVSYFPEGNPITQSIPFIQEAISPDKLPLEYIFDFVVNKLAYKEGECYYFILVAVPFETSSVYPFSISHDCIRFNYNQGAPTGMSMSVKAVGLTTLLVICVCMILPVILLLCLLVCKMRTRQKEFKEDGSDVVDTNKVKSKKEKQGVELKESSIKKHILKIATDSDSSMRDNAPLINRDYHEVSSD